MQRRDAVLRAMKDHPISQRRACVLIGVDPKTVRRERPPDNPEIREEMHRIAEKRRRFGYRRVGIMLERKGMIMNEKKLPDLPGGRAVGAPPSWPQTGTRQPNPNAGAIAPEPAVVVGLPVRHVRGLPEVRSPLFLNQWRTMARPGCQRRLLPREPCPDCRHQHLGGQSGSRTRCAGQDLRQAQLHCQ